MEFKEILRTRRKELGLTQQDIADLFGIKSVNVSDWERGEGMPEAAKLLRLAKRLGLSVSQLLGEHDLRQPSTADNAPQIEYTLHWLNREEAQLITDYRSTDDGGRATILNISTIVPKISSPAAAINDA